MRGTDNANSLGNWFSNVEYFTDQETFNGKSCNIHQGFLKVINQNYDKIMEVVNDVLGATGNNKILVSGHSLGNVTCECVEIQLICCLQVARWQTFSLPRSRQRGLM